MKRTYAPPRLAEYGRLAELTLGQGGSKPDFLFTGAALVNTGTSCDATSSNVTACLVAS